MQSEFTTQDFDFSAFRVGCHPIRDDLTVQELEGIHNSCYSGAELGVLLAPIAFKGERIFSML